MTQGRRTFAQDLMINRAARCGFGFAAVNGWAGTGTPLGEAEQLL